MNESATIVPFHLRTTPSGLRLTRVVILERGHIVDVAVDDDVQAVGLVVRRDVARRKDLGHCEG